MNKKSIAILKLLNQKERLTFHDLAEVSGCLDNPYQNPYISILVAEGYITYSSKTLGYGNAIQRDALFRITVKGIDFLQNNKQDTVHFWIPVIISILALLIALASLSIDFVQLLTTT